MKGPMFSAAVALVVLLRTPALGQEVLVATEILGRPTDSSVTLNVVPRYDTEAYVEYGTSPGLYLGRTDVVFRAAGQPIEILVDGLLPDRRYYYRLRYRLPPEAAFAMRPEYFFHTQRGPRSTFVFDVQTDPHLGVPGSPDRDVGVDTVLYKIALQNQESDEPNFLLDLGDTFMNESYYDADYETTQDAYLAHRPFFGIAGHSAPLFLVNGNHEGELGWKLDGTADNLALWSVRARNLYYPNPVPGGFYSGSTADDPHLVRDSAIANKRRDGYYAWEWGSALFVVLDPYWYTTTKPSPYGPNPDEGWKYTLGETQHAWLRGTLEQSPATFKFVFLHNLVGGLTKDGRGGIEAAPYYEWGGADVTGAPGWDAQRGWSGGPIHDLLVANDVTMVLHGHDHFFFRQELDGVIYQECPQPGRTEYTDAPASAAYYGYVEGILRGNSGHLRFTVSDTTVVVEYVRAYRPQDETAQRHNGDVAYTYTIHKPGAIATPGEYSLSPARPSPFTAATTIAYELPSESRVTLRVYDVRGRVVALLVDEVQPAGSRTATWQAGNAAGGVYFYRLEAVRRDDPGRPISGVGRVVLVR